MIESLNDLEIWALDTNQKTRNLAKDEGVYKIDLTNYDLSNSIIITNTQTALNEHNQEVCIYGKYTTPQLASLRFTFTADESTVGHQYLPQNASPKYSYELDGGDCQNIVFEYIGYNSDNQLALKTIIVRMETQK